MYPGTNAEDGEEDVEEDDAQMNLFQEYLLAQEEAKDGGQPFHEWAQDHYEAPVRDMVNAAVAEMTQQQVSCNLLFLSSALQVRGHVLGAFCQSQLDRRRFLPAVQSPSWSQVLSQCVCFCSLPNHVRRAKTLFKQTWSMYPRTERHTSPQWATATTGEPVDLRQAEPSWKVGCFGTSWHTSPLWAKARTGEASALAEAEHSQRLRFQEEALCHHRLWWQQVRPSISQMLRVAGRCGLLDCLLLFQGSHQEVEVVD